MFCVVYHKEILIEGKICIREFYGYNYSLRNFIQYLRQKNSLEKRHNNFIIFQASLL